MDSRNKLRIVFGDVTVGIHGEDFHYIFSKQTGGMESLDKSRKRNGCIELRIPHSGERLQIMTEETDSL